MDAAVSGAASATGGIASGRGSYPAALDELDGESAAGGGAAGAASVLHHHHRGGSDQLGPGGDLDSSPKSAARAKDVSGGGGGGGGIGRDGGGAPKRGNLKLHHVNKGKQQRDRRKLREKRRSTGQAL